jgi:3-oxoadipate enol-lactonase
VTGVRLNAQVSGPAARPVVVMGCSLGTTSRMWAAVAARLAESYRVIVLDTRGHGGSPVPAAPYSIRDLGADAVLTLDALGVDRFAFVGLSLGGQVGMWLASEWPERVDRLSLWCTGPVLSTPAAWHERVAAVRAHGMASIADAVVARWFTSAYAVAHPDAVASWRDELASIDPEGYAGCCEALAGADLRERLAAITAPTLVVAGAQDPIAPPAVLTDLANQLSSSRLEVVSDASHLAAIEQPDVAAALLLDHLAGNGDPDG